jgi:quercetin dioxygenase-like cupin family protein
MSGDEHTTIAAAAERLSFLGRRLPAGFELRVVVVAPGTERADKTDWRDALVVVERGEIELETSAGGVTRVVAGDVLWLCDLPLRSLRNRGREYAVVVAVSRRRPISAAER